MEVNGWKPGLNCRTSLEEDCDGQISADKALAWDLPIAPLLTKDLTDKAETFEFEARWDGIPCNATHSLIVVHYDGLEQLTFAELSKQQCTSLDEYLRRIARKIE